MTRPGGGDAAKGGGDGGGRGVHEGSTSEHASGHDMTRAVIRSRVYPAAWRHGQPVQEAQPQMSR